tara:strand:- start:1438 stop:3393 length:1956 start_codon:yes stop_codon:yes gene_type:complete
MKQKNRNTLKLQALSFFVIPHLIFADNFKYNSYNNHGSVGLINMPTARLYDEGAHGIVFYDGTPDQKITLISNPYDWFEASFFYTNIQGLPYPGFEFQDYKDKGFNIKIRLKKEGFLPAVAVGLNDFAGTGLYSSEYIVGSYGINKMDMHFGLGWNRLGGSDFKTNNPFGYLDDRFKIRPSGTRGAGGQFDPARYFSGEKVAPFFGISYAYKDSFLLKFEKDTTKTSGNRLFYENPDSDFSLGVDYTINDSFIIGASFERGNYLSLRFVYKNNPKTSIRKYEYQEPSATEGEDEYSKLIKSLEKNGIGVNKIFESSRSIGIELTQFVHSDIKLIEEIISEATTYSGIDKNVQKDIKIANLNAVSEINDSFKKDAKTIYQKAVSRRFNTSTGARFRPFFASREEFFKGAFLIENNSEFIIRDNLFFNTNLKYSLADNFDDFRFPPVDTYPAQVRSDVKQYLKNMSKGILIGRAQFDYYITSKKNHHIMLTGGILEDMFSGYGVEYLYFRQNTNFSFGLEAFNVRKRDYNWGFGHLDYKNNMVQANFYYRNYGLIPFDMKISAGEYLAGDVGTTIEFSRTFENGVRFGAFATFTDVSREQYGEGSFDKGIFFNVPIFGNSIAYTWKPLTKDPGAKLIRRNTLHDLLVRFKSIN